MRVELVGGLGIGKTTLCRSLEIIGFNCIYSNGRANPFLDEADEGDSRFPAQMRQALHYFDEIRKAYNPVLINIMEQGVINLRAQARLTFGNEDRAGQAILMQAIEYLEEAAGEPDLIVHLKASPAEAMRRIRARGRAEDAQVSMGYIASFQQEIGQMVTRARMNGQNVLTVDTEENHLPGNMPYAESLARLIAGTVYQPQEGRAPRPRRIPANDKTPLLQYVEMAEAM